MSRETIGEWTNWSGSVSCEPDRIATPEEESELQRLVQQCREEDGTVRVVGSGHSWTPVVETEDTLVSLERMTGIVSCDEDAREVTVRGGTTLGEGNTELHERNLAFPNLGDVSEQMIAGAFCTGTHGTGLEFRNLSDALVGGRLVTGTGEIEAFDADSDPELLEAARVSLGTLGIFTELRLDLQSTFKIQRREYCTSFEAFWDQYETLVRENRNFDFYWYPRSDEVKLRLLNPPGGGTDHSDLEYATLVTKETGWWHQVIPAHNEIGRKFEEMEYSVPLSVGKEAFEEVRDRVRERWRGDVGWRLLVRTVAADDAHLSTEYDRDTMTISLIQNAELDYWDYFEDVEPIFRSYDGRPHWGKHHTLRAAELRELYPKWDRFQEIRHEMDPDGVFVTDYLSALLDGTDDAARSEGVDGA